MTETTEAVVADNNQEAEATAENETQQQEEVTTDSGKDEGHEPKKQNYVKKLQTEKREAMELAEQALQQIEQLKKEKKEEVAIAKFGEEVVKDETVTSYMDKYPEMTYGEAIKLAGIDPKPSQGSPYGMPGIPVSTKKDKEPMSIDDLEKGLAEAIAKGDVSV